MRRSQSIRKALVATLVLVVFMLVLRVFRPDDSALDIEAFETGQGTAEKKVTHHPDVIAKDENLALEHQNPVKPAAAAQHAAGAKDAPAAKEAPVAKDAKDKPVGNAAPADNASPRDKVAPAAKDAAPADEPAGPPFDAEKAYKDIVHAKTSPPVVIFSKSYCPHSARAKQLLLEEYKIVPQPLVVELDEHPNGPELQQYIGEQTSRRTVPNIIINGISRGGASDMVELGDLILDKIQEWGGKKLTIRRTQ